MKTYNMLLILWPPRQEIFKASLPPPSHLQSKATGLDTANTLVLGVLGII